MSTFVVTVCNYSDNKMHVEFVQAIDKKEALSRSLWIPNHDIKDMTYEEAVEMLFDDDYNVLVEEIPNGTN